MNLTKTDKAAFVRAVMADVPQPDFEARLAAMVSEWDREAMPTEIRAIWDAPSLRPFLKTNNRVSFPGPLIDPRTVMEVKVGEDRQVLLQALADQCRESENKFDAAETQMAAMIAPFRTLKQAKERLPEELHKYLPADRDATGVANLPAVASPVDLLKAMGWPK